MFQNITVIATGDKTTKTTKTNKPYKQLTVREENGTEHKVNIWSDFPDFANVKIGTVIRGKLEPNGQYMNLVSEMQVNKPTGAGGAFKQAQIEKTMEKKNESIGKFQDNKEFSIMVASSMTNAVNLAIAEFKDKTVLDTLDQAVLKWRKFILDNWEVDPKDIKPF